MPGALDGKVAVITGASSGIGEAAARALAREGAAVVLAARREAQIAELADRIVADGGRALAVATDVTVEQQANHLISRAHGELGRLDILVNNAGLMLLGPVNGADSSHWRRMIEVNLLGLLYCTRAALPIMHEQSGGHVVNLSSVAGRTARAGAAVYNMTKWGVGAFSEALRQESVAAGIRVTVIEPGFVDTELQGHNEHPAVREALQSARESIGEILEPDDIAQAIVYAVTRPARVSINEVLVRPTGQAQ